MPDPQGALMKLTDSPGSPDGADAKNEPAPRVRLPRRVRERQMIDVATEIFGGLGYHGTSMDQIAVEAGISKPMLYAYFNSKDGLYSACLRRAGADLLETVRESFRPEDSAEKHLWDGFLAFFSFIRDKRTAWQLVRLESFYENPAFREIVEDVHNDLRGVIGDLARVSSQQTPDDPFSDDERRTAMAHAMLGAAESLGTWWTESEAPLEPDVPCRHLMNFLWLGMQDLAEGQIWTETRVRSEVTS
ncbi:MAG: TetR/AcrR family transcriptional regulator [Solirubrobacterales bacterium]